MKTGKLLRFARAQDADAVAGAFDKLYPAYKFYAEQPKGCRVWLVSCCCKATGAFLRFYPLGHAGGAK